MSECKTDVRARKVGLSSESRFLLQMAAINGVMDASFAANLLDTARRLAAKRLARLVRSGDMRRVRHGKYAVNRPGVCPCCGKPE